MLGVNLKCLLQAFDRVVPDTVIPCEKSLTGRVTNRIGARRALASFRINASAQLQSQHATDVSRIHKSACDVHMLWITPGVELKCAREVLKRPGVLSSASNDTAASRLHISQCDEMICRAKDRFSAIKKPGRFFRQAFLEKKPALVNLNHRREDIVSTVLRKRSGLHNVFK